MIPAHGATKLRVKGFVNLRTASDEKTLQEKGVALKMGAKVKLGPVEISRGKSPVVVFDDKAVDDDRVYVNVAYTNNVLKGIQFLDADGKALPCEQVGHFAFGSGGDTHITESYAIQSKVERATVLITYFSKTQTVKVPFDLRIGMGL